MSPMNVGHCGKSDVSEKSNSNYSTDNKSMQRSRKESSASIDTISDSKILITITEIS